MKLSCEDHRCILRHPTAFVSSRLCLFTDSYFGTNVLFLYDLINQGITNYEYASDYIIPPEQMIVP